MEVGVNMGDKNVQFVNLDSTSINFVPVSISILVVVLIIWFFYRYLFNLFDCVVLEEKLQITLGSQKILEFPIATITNIRRASLLDILANPFAFRLVNFSMYIRPSVMITVGKMKYIVTPRNINNLDGLIKRFENQV